jgi:hypothetical protein
MTSSTFQNHFYDVIRWTDQFQKMRQSEVYCGAHGMRKRDDDDDDDKSSAHTQSAKTLLVRVKRRILHSFLSLQKVLVFVYIVLSSSTTVQGHFV